MDRNPFLAYLGSHSDADVDVLKDLFRLLAKRTHPDLGASDSEGFVRLQEHYHEALAALVARDEAGPEGIGTPHDGRPARVVVLGALYRYKSHLPHMDLDGRELPDACRRAFDAAVDGANRYTSTARLALEAFDEQFHTLRSTNARYPDVRVKYANLLRGLCSFFDYQFMPNAFNLRVARSYLAEIGPVTYFDPSASPQMRRNRSAAARSALYRMKSWIDAELDLPVTQFV